MATETTAPTTNGIAHGTVPKSTATAKVKPTSDRKPVPSGKGLKSPDERHADRAHVERLAADLAAERAAVTAAEARAVAAEAQAAAESAARESVEAQAEADRKAAQGAAEGHAALLAEVTALREQLLQVSAPVVASQMRALPFAAPEGPDGGEECPPALVYTAAANEFRPFDCLVVGVHTWPDGRTMLKVRAGKPVGVLHPFGPQTAADGTVHAAIELPAGHALMVPVDGSLMGLAARYVHESHDPKGAHALGAHIRPELQITTDAGFPIVTHRAWVLRDFGPGTAAALDVDPAS